MGEREGPVRRYWTRLAGGDGGAAEGCCVIGVIKKKMGIEWRLKGWGSDFWTTGLKFWKRR